MTRDQLLAQLQDISPPVSPAWWLPAPGQLVATLALLALLAIAAAWLLRRHLDRRVIRARRELRRIAAEHAADGDPLGLARALAPWLKRVALQAYPGQQIEAISGAAWLEFLDHGSGGEDFSSGVGRVFGAAIYRAEPLREVDAGALLELCDSWLTGIAPRLRGGAA